jgi:uncharacterized protein (DUF169 family)
MPIPPVLIDSLAAVGLDRAPVAVAFLAQPPQGLARLESPGPAGCSYWKTASEGRAFYTTTEHHTNCPIGAFTHGVALSPEVGKELETMIDTMIELKYIRKEEVPAFPHRTDPLDVVAYAPLDGAPFDPDVVIFRGTVKQVMLLAEAARGAGAFDDGQVMGRPACAMLPRAIGASTGVASMGCIGNRVYTGLGDDELYLAIPGAKVGAVLEHLGATLAANQQLEQFHRQRASGL